LAKAAANRLPNKEDLLAIWQASGLKEKLLFTLIMIVVFRLAAHIPIWGVDPQVFATSAAAQFIGILDMFSGGALGRLSIVGLGIGPYITASIIMQLLTVVIPKLESLQKEEGEAGRKKLAQITRYATVGLAIMQSIVIVNFVVQFGGVQPGVSMQLFATLAVITMTAGAVLALWLAEMITERGVGNGASLLIFIGIISRLPITFGQIGQAAATGTPAEAFMLLLTLLVFLATVAFVVILQEASRKVFIVSAKRQVGNKMYGGQSTHIPFKINPGGVLPIIFAFSVLAFPITLINMAIRSSTDMGVFQPVIMFLGKYLAQGGWMYIGLEVLLIFFFTFFYASIMPNMQPKDISENLKKYGSSIPGIKPGRPTAEFLQTMLSRIVFIGASFMAILVLVPNSVESYLSQATGVMLMTGLGATSLIIMVGVALDFVNQVKVHLLARQYEGFLKS
jgi:preprotein translocase subunit SecY